MSPSPKPTAFVFWLTAFGPIKYKIELKDSAALSELHALLRIHRDVTLLYAAKDEQHNQALALQQYI